VWLRSLIECIIDCLCFQFSLTPQSHRITLTFHALNARSDECIFAACGGGKSDVLTKVFKLKEGGETTSITEGGSYVVDAREKVKLNFPCAMVKQFGGEVAFGEGVKWVVDIDAARGINTQD